MVRPQRLVLPVPPLPATAMVKPMILQVKMKNAKCKCQNVDFSFLILHFSLCILPCRLTDLVLLPDFLGLPAGHLALGTGRIETPGAGLAEDRRGRLLHEGEHVPGHLPD